MPSIRPGYLTIKNSLEAAGGAALAMLTHTEWREPVDSGRRRVFLLRSGLGQAMDVHWAGVPFTPMFHHDGRFFRCPGLFGFVRRGIGEDRTLLFVDHAKDIANAVCGHALWADALRLGMNELNVNLEAQERIDQLILRDRVIQRCEPLLNLISPDLDQDLAHLKFKCSIG